MMKPTQHTVLTREVNVVPGDTADSGKAREGGVGIGRADIRVRNLGRRENVFRVDFSPPIGINWNRRWLRVLPDAVKRGGVEPDVADDEQSVSMLVRSVAYDAQGQPRLDSPNFWDVFLPFSIPSDPNANSAAPLRSQVLPLRLTIEQDVQGGAATEFEPLETLEFNAIIRPVYRWTASFENTTDNNGTLVGLGRINYFRKKRNFKLGITNHSNEWLYLRLSTVTTSAITVEQESKTIALEPAGDMPSSRDVLFTVTAKKRRFFDIVGEFPWNVKLERVDAPSIPRLSDKDLKSGSNAGLGGAVLSVEPGDPVGKAKELPSPQTVPAILRQSPLIYKRWSDFVQSIIRNVQGLFAFVIMGMITVVGIHMLIQQFEVNKFKKSQVSILNRDRIWNENEALRMGKITASTFSIVYFENGVEKTIPVAAIPNLKNSSLDIPFDEVKNFWRDLKESEAVKLRITLTANIWSFISGINEFPIKIAGATQQAKELKIKGVFDSQEPNSFRIQSENKLGNLEAIETESGEKLTVKELDDNFYLITFSPPSDGVEKLVVKLKDGERIKHVSIPVGRDAGDPTEIISSDGENEGAGSTSTDGGNTPSGASNGSAGGGSASTASEPNEEGSGATSNHPGDQLANLMLKEHNGSRADTLYAELTSSDEPALRAYALAATGRASSAQNALGGSKSPLALVARVRIMNAGGDSISFSDFRGSALALLEVLRSGNPNLRAGSRSALNRMKQSNSLTAAESELFDALNQN